VSAANDWQVALEYRRRDQDLAIGIRSATERVVVPTLHVSLPVLFDSIGLTRRDALLALGEADGAAQDAAPPGGRDADAEQEGGLFHDLRVRAIPDDLTGRTVLDVGGYNGYFARLCLDRGARQATVVDNGEWQNYHWVPPSRDEEVRRIGCDVLEWQEPADVTILYNVVYHLRDPWRALWHMRCLTRDLMVLCTPFVAGDAAAWHVTDPDTTGMVYENYLTSYWTPTVPGLLLLLRRTGWTDVEEVGRTGEATGDHIVLRCR
jgi:hypothetical protein